MSERGSCLQVGSQPYVRWRKLQGVGPCTKACIKQNSMGSHRRGLQRVPEALLTADSKSQRKAVFALAAIASRDLDASAAAIIAAAEAHVERRWDRLQRSPDLRPDKR